MTLDYYSQQIFPVVVPIQYTAKIEYTSTADITNNPLEVSVMNKHMSHLLCHHIARRQREKTATPLSDRSFTCQSNIIL